MLSVIQGTEASALSLVSVLALASTLALVGFPFLPIKNKLFTPYFTLLKILPPSLLFTFLRLLLVVLSFSLLCYGPRVLSLRLGCP